MTRLATTTAARLRKALERRGFSPVRRKGSHVFMRHPDGRGAVVPEHRPGVDIGRGLLVRIARDVGLSPEELAA